MQSSPIEILIVDDCAEDREWIRCLLQASTERRYRIREAQTAGEAAQVLSENAPDCILLDYRLPDSNGLFLLREYSLRPLGVTAPIVLMTGSTDTQISTAALQHGAQDFLAKQEITLQTLERTLQHAMVRFRLAQQREAAANALAARENLLHLAQEVAEIGTWELNLLTGETRCGGAYFELYGMKPDDGPISFDQWLEKVHPADRARIRHETQRAIASGAEFNDEFRVLWPDGTLHWLLGRAAVVRDDAGQPQRVVGVNIDITRSKLAEQALVSANEELRQFAFTAGHDLQAPLRTIGAFVDLLEQSLAGNPDPNIRQLLQFVRGGSEQMRSLVHDLLDYAQSGGKTESAPVPLERLLERAIENLASDIQASGAQITWDELSADASFGSELIQVFQNLLGNAIQYRRKGIPPAIQVHCTRHAREWLFAVQDNGQGFDMTHSDVIFQPFKRLVTHNRAGTGLGLPICKRIVERRGGRIWAESKPGAGTTFFFTLPAAEVTISAEPPGEGDWAKSSPA